VTTKTSTREILHSSETVEWYTPVKYIESARKVMGSIDLDPASCAVANKLIKAKIYFNKRKNGLSRDWFGNVWLNPPYGRGGQSAWTQKILEQYQIEYIDQGILLVNAATDTNWFTPLWGYPICFVRNRIKFISEDGQKKHNPTHANVFVYFGKNRNDFIDEFTQYGPVITKVVR
jgi:ParB family chromosome partitioning protein